MTTTSKYPVYPRWFGRFMFVVSLLVMPAPVWAQQHCFSADTPLWFEQQPQTLAEFLFAPMPMTTVTTLSESATLAEPTLVEQPILLVEPSLYEGTLVQIDLVSGQQIKVTPGHPMVDGEGNVVEASDLKPGDTLLTVNGAQAIAAMASVDFAGLLWNIEPNADTAKGNVLVADGIFSGGLGYYTSESNEYRLHLRESLAEQWMAKKQAMVALPHS